METQQAPSAYWVQIDPYTQTPPPLYDLASDLTSDLTSVPNGSIVGSPESSQFDAYSVPFHHTYSHVTDDLSFSYGALPMTPSDSSCLDDSPYCSPQPSIAHIYPSPPLPAAPAPHFSPASVAAVLPPASLPLHHHQQQQQQPHSSLRSSFSSTPAVIAAAAAAAAERTHATSGRRRAQNRAAQRAFRERKEKHARDLEEALKEMTGKWKGAESRVRELEQRYEKLRKTVELLVGGSNSASARNGGSGSESCGTVVEGDTVRRVLEVLCGEDDFGGGRRED